MTDDFFDDEEELMEASAPAASENEESGQAEAAEPASDVEPSEAKASAPKKAAQKEYVRDVPPFWMVLAIAAIALLLGVIVGYLIGTTTVVNSLSASTTATTEEASGYELPEGHPSVEIDEDGNATVVDTGSSSES